MLVSSLLSRGQGVELTIQMSSAAACTMDTLQLNKISFLIEDAPKKMIDFSLRVDHFGHVLDSGQSEGVGASHRGNLHFLP